MCVAQNSLGTKGTCRSPLPCYLSMFPITLFPSLEAKPEREASSAEGSLWLPHSLELFSSRALPRFLSVVSAANLDFD